MKVLVYRKCSTCMKALKWLEAHNVERPLVIGDDFVLTGFREKEWSEAMHM